eukprot:CAMPEP_0197637806 /NCGR_PEP_ID=MMETSP1338-20131121/12916_1 /TAXON_ID=43686 ORGANISM="Pelagodinium beii, Strain RCC1491" /NCGR_SAMPLE_ID=MMETSP1338 /ASSEMBLY_ACC=CAM_ASM_000754 /LENGTH=64 /DNA_ID=CAMNT_0043210277 /DNA_START=71 /DNA_END=265 /DNA_ORIENTATION=-
MPASLWTRMNEMLTQVQFQMAVELKQRDEEKRAKSDFRIHEAKAEGDAKAKVEEAPASRYVAAS